MPTAEANLTAKSSLYKLTIGIRHQRAFGLLDASGMIVDTIGRAKDSPFPKNFFSQVGEGQRRERRIANADSSSYVDITTDDLIFQYTLEHAFEDDFSWIVKKCVPFFLTRILRAHGVSEYLRLGVVFSHRLPAPPILNAMVSDVTSSKMADPETIVFRISKKAVVDEALVKKNVDDWGNVILTLDKKENGMVDFDVDIQHYFNPFPEQLDEFDYQGFFQRAKNLLFGTYHQMIDAKFIKSGALESK